MRIEFSPEAKGEFDEGDRYYARHTAVRNSLVPWRAAFVALGVRGFCDAGDSNFQKRYNSTHSSFQRRLSAVRNVGTG